MRKPPERTKKQHVVPRFYLERFVDSDGQVWSYDFERDDVQPAQPKDTGLQTNFYSPQKDGGQRFDELELWLSRVEADAAPLFPDLEEGKLFRGEDREKISIFLAAQYLRSPMMVSTAADMMGQFAHLIALSYAGKNNQATDPDLSLDDREKMREFLSDPKNYKINVLQHAGLPVLAGTANLAKLIMKMTWFVSEVQNQHLITSDSPVVKVYDAKTYHPVYGDGGFANKTMYVTFPLSPHRMLELAWGRDEVSGVIEADKQRGRLYNRQRAHWAKRFLYADRHDGGVVRLGDKHIKSDNRPRITTGRLTPEIDVKRKL